MTREENEQFVRNLFAEARPRLIQLVERFVDEPEVVLEQATANFDRMVPDMAYVDNPKHPMAWAVFDCSGYLAVYLALKGRGVDVHDFGNAILAAMAEAPHPEPKSEQPADVRPMKDRFAEFAAVAEASQRDALPGEYVYEAVLGDRTEFDWGVNIKSCAICSVFSKHDAMDLVPYMCAADDVVSDRESQGLLRTGTIAVGAHQCDFRYKRGRKGQHLAKQYPDRIRVVEKN
jgi:hypothetical protein